MSSSSGNGGEPVRYGDTIKLWTVSQYLKDTEYTSGGYIGVYSKGTENGRVAVPPIGPNAVGRFVESIFTIVDPSGTKNDTEVLYEDVVVLMRDDGLIWNNRILNSSYMGFFEGYIGFAKKRSDGQLFLSFEKNGCAGKPMIYGDIGVYLNVEASYRHKYAFNYRITNYKASSSMVVGGYLVSDNTGFDVSFQVHRHSGPPNASYQYSVPARALDRYTSVRLFVPPKINYVGVRRKDSAFRVIDKNDDVMMTEPMYGSKIKLYDVSPNDDIVIVMEDETVFELEADQLFRTAEANAGHGTTMELSIAVSKKSQAPIIRRGSSTVVQLTALDVVVDMDVETLRDFFPEKFIQKESINNKVSKVAVIKSFLKLVVVYYVCAAIIPYIYCETILLMGYLVEPLGSYLNSSSLSVFTNVATRLLSFKGVNLDDGLPSNPYDTINVVTYEAVWFAFTTCFFFGCITPAFIRDRARPAQATDEEDDQYASWVITLVIPNMDLGAGLLPEKSTRRLNLESTRRLNLDQSTRTLGAFSDSDEEEEGEDEDGDYTGTDVSGDESEDDEFKVNGVRLGGKYGLAGVDSNGVPLHPAFKRFLDGEKGNMDAAKKRWIRTCEWRREGHIDDILKTPPAHFFKMKECLPNYIYGRSKTGYPIYIDRPGHAKIKELRKADIGLNELLYHFTYVTEFLWTVIEPREDGKRISILDLENVGMFDLKGIVLDYIKKTIFLAGEHYPERGHKIYIINVPTFFSGIWAVIKGMMNEATVSKISILKGVPTQKLLEEIDESVLPIIYGGKNPLSLSESAEEKILEKHVKSIFDANKEA